MHTDESSKSNLFFKKTDESVIKAKNHINYKKYDIIHTIIGVSKDSVYYEI